MALVLWAHTVEGDIIALGFRFEEDGLLRTICFRTGGYFGLALQRITLWLTPGKARRRHGKVCLTHGFFWIPCPLCGSPYGGDESRLVVLGDPSLRTSIPHGDNRCGGRGICPACVEAGYGDVAWDRWHHSQL